MTDEEALALTPAVREFIDAVNDRDHDVVEACFAFTDPRALAVLAAALVGELRDQLDDAARAARLAQTGAREARREMSTARRELSDALKKVTELQGELFLARNERWVA